MSFESAEELHINNPVLSKIYRNASIGRHYRKIIQNRRYSWHSTNFNCKIFFNFYETIGTKYYSNLQFSPYFLQKWSIM